MPGEPREPHPVESDDQITRKLRVPERPKKTKSQELADFDREIGGETTRPEELEKAVQKARAVTAEIRKKELEKLPGGAATPQEIAEQRAMVEAAYESAGELPGSETQKSEPLLEQEPAETREQAVQQETLGRFSREQLKFALEQAVQTIEAEQQRDPVKQQEFLARLKVLLPSELVLRHGPELQKELGVQRLDPEFVLEMYKAEDPAVRAVLERYRSQFSLPYLSLEYRQNRFVTEVHDLVPELERGVTEGKLKTKELEPQLERLGERGQALLEKLRATELESGSLSQK